MPPKTKKRKCELCSQEIKASEDALQCTGPCKAHVHRYCAAVTENHYKEIVNSKAPFMCLFCTQKTHSEEITSLRSEVDSLKLALAQVQQQLSSTQRDTALPTPTLSSDQSHVHVSETKSSYASALNVNRNAPPRRSTVQSVTGRHIDRKFNIVVYGLQECPNGSPRHVRISKDMDSVCGAIQSLCPNLSDQSICDCSRLGKYSETRSRPVLVKLARSCDVSLILSSRHKLSGQSSSQSQKIYIKPFMSASEKLTESALLKERRALINSGVDRQSIKIRGNFLYVNNSKYGTASESIFTACNPTVSITSTPEASSDQSVPPTDDLSNQHIPSPNSVQPQT